MLILCCECFSCCIVGYSPSWPFYYAGTDDSDSLPRLDVLCPGTMAMQALLYLFSTESFDWFWRWGRHWRRPRRWLAGFRPRESGGGVACRLARWTRRRRRVKEYSSDDLLAKFSHLEGLSPIISPAIIISLSLCCRRRSLWFSFFFYLFLYSSSVRHKSHHPHAGLHLEILRFTVNICQHLYSCTILVTKLHDSTESATHDVLWLNLSWDVLAIHRLRLHASHKHSLSSKHISTTEEKEQPWLHSLGKITFSDFLYQMKIILSDYLWP